MAGVLGLLGSANHYDEGYAFYVGNGDLVQMSAQKEFLRRRGFDIGQRDVYPCVKTEEEQVRALKAIWEARVDGWWNHDRDLVRLGICTREEYNTALGIECEKER